MTVRAAGRPERDREAQNPGAGRGRRAARRRRWWPDAVLVAVFVLITAALGLAPVRELDLAIRDLVDAHRPYPAALIAQTLNRLGSGGVLTSVCLVIAAVVGIRRRSWWPFLPVIAAFLLTGAVIQPLKLILDRPAPHAGLPDDTAVRLFGAPEAVSYPSGHAVNAVVWYAVIALLLAPRLTAAAHAWLRVAPPLIVTVAGTYLGYHWFTDMLAGLALAVPLSHLVQALSPTNLGPPAHRGSGAHD